MNLLQRIKNIWRLSECIDFPTKELSEGTKVVLNIREPIKPFQIIKRTTPAQDFLKTNKDE